MKINEFAARAITINGKTIYSCAIVYQIGKGTELMALVTVDLDAHKATVNDLGCERSGSKAEAERERLLRQCAYGNAARMAVDDGECSMFAHWHNRNGGMERL